MLYKKIVGGVEEIQPLAPTYRLRWAKNYTVVEVKFEGQMVLELNPRDYDDLRLVAAKKVAEMTGVPEHFYVEVG